MEVEKVKELVDKAGITAVFAVNTALQSACHTDRACFNKCDSRTLFSQLPHKLLRPCVKSRLIFGKLSDSFAHAAC